MPAPPPADFGATSGNGRPGPSPEHPRPQLRRAGWRPLDGTWRSCFDDDGAYDDTRRRRGAVGSRSPRRPPRGGSPSTRGRRGYHAVCWYEREFEPPAPGGADGGRVLLHFGAVDYEARVWVNGHSVGGHTGGHTPFTFDVTDV